MTSLLLSDALRTRLLSRRTLYAVQNIRVRGNIRSGALCTITRAYGMYFPSMAYAPVSSPERILIASISGASKLNNQVFRTSMTSGGHAAARVRLRFEA